MYLRHMTSVQLVMLKNSILQRIEHLDREIATEESLIPIVDTADFVLVLGVQRTDLSQRVVEIEHAIARLELHRKED